MYSLVSKRDSTPTAYELERLRKSERTAILNNLIFESADMLADFAFILVMFGECLRPPSLSSARTDPDPPRSQTRR